MRTARSPPNCAGNSSPLLIDTEKSLARYSAAGHPPLLFWHAADDRLGCIESNGHIFEVVPDSPYPTVEIPVTSSDRFVFYIDGVTEPENSAGEAFGDHRLETVLRKHGTFAAPDLRDRILAELRAWQPASLLQQDDITLFVLDVL